MAVRARGVGQRVGIEAGVVGQRMVFEIVLGVFDGIEFRGIRRQQDRVDGAGVGHEPLDCRRGNLSMFQLVTADSAHC